MAVRRDSQKSDFVMSSSPQFFFDFGSPASYLAWKRLPDLETRTGVTLEPRGVLAQYNPASQALEVRISHQMPHQLQRQMPS